MPSQPALDPNIFLVSALIALGLAGVLILFVLVYQRRLMRQQEDFRQIETSYQQRMLAAAIEVQEAERTRIAQDLHDGIGSMLSAVSLQLSQVRRAPDLGDHNRAALNASREQLSEAIQSVREVSHNLSPPVLARLGLVAALKQLVGRVPTPQVEFRSELGARNLPPNISLGLYRVVQEALNNSLRHAEAQSILIDLRAEADGLRVDYRDDGRGFDYQRMGPSVGLGLLGIESRIQVLGGSMQLTSQPGAGVFIQIALPWPAEIPDQQPSILDHGVEPSLLGGKDD
jgi:signal transduction histidine kinase